MPERGGFGWPDRKCKNMCIYVYITYNIYLYIYTYIYIYVKEVKGSGDLKQNHWQSNAAMSHLLRNWSPLGRTAGPFWLLIFRIKTTAVDTVDTAARYGEIHSAKIIHSASCGPAARIDSSAESIVQLCPALLRWSTSRLHHRTISWVDQAPGRMMLDPAASKWPLVTKPAPLQFEREMGHFWTASEYGVQMCSTLKNPKYDYSTSCHPVRSCFPLFHEAVQSFGMKHNWCGGDCWPGPSWHSFNSFQTYHGASSIRFYYLFASCWLFWLVLATSWGNTVFL
jgi:hypothetical protein